MKKRALKKIAILAAPIIWRKIHARRSRRYWPRHRHHHWHDRTHYCGHQGRRVWL